MMEGLLVVIRPKSNAPATQDYRARAYDILLLDTKLSTYDKSRTLKQLPKCGLDYSEEPTQALLAYVYHTTGGDQGGLKGKRAVFLSPGRTSLQTDQDSGASVAKGSLFCVPLDSKDKLNSSFVETSRDTPGFYSLDFILDSLNNSLLNYASQTRTMLLRLEGWLKEKHKIPGAIDLLFSSPPANRLKQTINNPAYVTASHVTSRSSLNQLGSMESNSQIDISDRSFANEALAKMMAIEKSDIVVMNPLFGAGLPYKNKCDAVVVNKYWGFKPDYKKITVPNTSRGVWTSEFPLHKCALEGDAKGIKQLIQEEYDVTKRDRDSWVAIHFAAWKGHLEAIQTLLVEGDCPVNITNDNGSTPLHLAARCGHPYVVELLLDHPGIDVNALDKDGQNALSCCVNNPAPNWQAAAALIKSAMDKPAKKITVFLMDGSKRELALVSGNNTTVQQLHHQMLEVMEMSEEDGRFFTIWICSRNLQLQLKQEHKPMMHLNDWGRTIIRKFTDQDPSKEVPQLFWRRDAILSINDEQKFVRHQTTVDLLFHEAYHNYITSLYPCADADIINIGGIIMQMRHGDYDNRKCRTFFSNEKNLQQLVPVSKLRSKNINWANKINNKYKEFSTKVKDKSFKMLQLHFLSICWNLTVYGSAFFTGYVQLKSTKSPTMVYVGVNDLGIHIIHGQNKTMLHSFSYKDIEQRHISESHVLEVWLKDRASHGAMSIMTKQAGFIFLLMNKMSSLAS